MRKILSLFLTIGLVLSLSLTGFANENNNLEIQKFKKELSEKDLLKEKNKKIEEEILKEIDKLGNKKDSIPQWEYKTEEIDSVQKYDYPMGYAGNQSPRGVAFKQKGGRIHWRDEGVEENITFSVSVAGGPISVGVCAGTGEVSSKVTEYSAEVPDEYINKKVKLFVYRDFDVTIHEMKRRRIYGNTGKYGDWEYVKTFPVALKVGIGLEIKKVNN
ncbi:hypothetical protein WG909_15160 (plasmid) [Peptostreptococcaceae bacterium AGR-M142]